VRARRCGGLARRAAHRPRRRGRQLLRPRRPLAAAGTGAGEDPRRDGPRHRDRRHVPLPHHQDARGARRGTRQDPGMSKHDIMEPIAIVGMSGRFPRAASIDAFWRRLRAGEECITFFSDEELLAAGVDPALLSDPHFVPARGFLEDADLFDATFFGFSPREAEIMDPQHRLFLESAWAALEDAGYAPTGEPQRGGIYAGASMNTYVITGIVENPAAILAAGGYQAMVSNDKDFIATRAAYKLNLSGPA